MLTYEKDKDNFKDQTFEALIEMLPYDEAQLVSKMTEQQQYKRPDIIQVIAELDELVMWKAASRTELYFATFKENLDEKS